MINHQENLLSIFDAALSAVSGERAVRNALNDPIYPDSFHVIAIGKAADSMVRGVPSERIKSGLLISKHGHFEDDTTQDSRLVCIESDHPVPNVASIKAGKALLQYLEILPENEPCLFLISGGASSLLEVLHENWDLKQLQELTDYLLAKAYPIDQINAIRRRISRIKGGGLWSYIKNSSVYCLLISDVPNDDPAVIGSGLLFPVSDSPLPNLPQEWADKIEPYQQYKVGDNFNYRIIASLEMAKKAAQKKADELGYNSHVIPSFLEGEATEVATDCVNVITNNPNTLCIWGGETTVTLPKNAGNGGRNQHLALAAAIAMQDQDNMFLLAAGTDGSDGLSSATGAIVDSKIIEAGEKLGLSAYQFLQGADSNAFFKELDVEQNCLLETGATGTNVMDLVMGIKTESSFLISDIF